MGFLVSDISAYLEVSDLCAMDAAAKEISVHMASWDGKRYWYAWLTVAMNADKSSISALLHAVRGPFDVVLCPLLERSSKGALELTKAALQMKKMEIKHMSVGGLYSKTFITRFQFTPQDIQSYLVDPYVAVSSVTVRIDMGDNVVVRMVLTWHKGTMLLSTHVTPEYAFQPLAVQLRSISSPLIMRKTFKLKRLMDTQEGSGLCCMTQTPTAFAENMKKGILCAGFVHDFVEPVKKYDVWYECID